MKANPTDDYIRKRLKNLDYGTVDEWSYLMKCTNNPELKSMCQDRISLAYHAEEYSAGIL